MSPNPSCSSENGHANKSPFRAVSSAHEARSLTDGVLLTPQFIRSLSDESNTTESSQSTSSTPKHQHQRPPVILPYMGFGTYKLANQATEATYQAIVHAGYRAMDTALIYSRQRTEAHVGQAIQRAIQDVESLERDHLFVTTKQWRSYHGYQPTCECLALSLERLQLDYLDLWLMHWPGPAWKPRNHSESSKQNTKQTLYDNDDEEEDEEEDVWNYAETASSAADMQALRAETWRAMEDAYLTNKVRAIGVCNFSVAHLQALEETCRIRPMVNQIELHPLYPQTELLAYCRDKGIVVQAYASLGGQDTTARDWQALWKTSNVAWSHHTTNESDDPSSNTPKKKSKKKGTKTSPIAAPNLLMAPPVQALAKSMNQTPGQILLQWTLSQNCVVIPKSSQLSRMRDNAQTMALPRLTSAQVQQLSRELLNSVTDVTTTNHASVQDGHLTTTEQETNTRRLCWRGDRLRMLDF